MPLRVLPVKLTVPGSAFMMRSITFCGCLFFACACAAQAASLVINPVAASSEIHSDYCLDLLRMALNASKTADEDISLNFQSLGYTQSRLLAELNHRPNAVAWSMSDNLRNQSMRVIRVPLYKGLLGKRVLVIRKELQPIFAQVQSLADLKLLVAGQGAQWPDTRILRENGLPVVSSLESSSLVRMLKGRRFDYYPRSVVEAAYELHQLQDAELKVEERLILSYPADLFFYVHQDNRALAARIEKGLHLLISSGEFDRYFYNHPRIQQALQILDAPGRKVLQLSNSQLDETLLNSEAEHWLSPGR